jgi:hypothetical protein
MVEITDLHASQSRSHPTEARLTSILHDGPPTESVDRFALGG